MLDLTLVSAVLINLLFFAAGIRKIGKFPVTVGGFMKRMPNFFPLWMGKLIIVAVIVLEVVAPLVIVYSFKTKKYTNQAYVATMALFSFTVLATLLYHFPPTGSAYYPFMSNMATIGGLLCLAQHLSKRGLNLNSLLK